MSLTSLIRDFVIFVYFFPTSISFLFDKSMIMWNLAIISLHARNEKQYVHLRYAG